MKKIIALFFTAYFFYIAVAQPVTITLNAAADNSIYQIPNTNSNALGQNIFSGNNGGGSPRRGLIKFDIAATVPPGAVITAVTLTLNCNLSRAQADDVNLHRLTGNWGEGTSNAGGGSGDGAGVPATTNDATWINTFFPAGNWANPGGDFAAAASATQSVAGTGFYNWASAAMIADVQNWLNTPAANFGWILICNETVISTARKFGSRENTVVTNRPSLSITYTTVLPVSLTVFTATTVNNNVTLHWTTQQENNNSHFEIMQSSDGILFYAIGSVPGNGTTSLLHQYQFTHAAGGKLFYKLTQVDFDGKKTHSFVITVSNILTAKNYEPVSNVVTQLLHLKNNSAVNTLYGVYNQQGQLVLNGKLVSNKINMAGLAAGVYYLCIYPASKITERYRFVKL